MTPPKPTSELFKDAVAFDELAVEDAALAATCVKIYASKPGIHHMDSDYFDEGARFESDRLRPILERVGKVLACVDQLNKCVAEFCDDKTCCAEYFEALQAAEADVRAALGGGE